jgi:hypothetical protein
VLVEQLELGADVRREGRLAVAEDRGPDEELALVDEARLEGPRREHRPADNDVVRGFGLQRSDRVGVEAVFEPGPGR